MNLKDIKGLKYPDLALVKFFFKQGLHTKGGRVLEYGCSNGNNLSLFASYDYECLGVDLDPSNLENARFNFEKVLKVSKFSFFEEDIVEFDKKHEGVRADVLLIPNVINYLSRKDFEKLLQNLSLYQADTQR